MLYFLEGKLAKGEKKRKKKKSENDLRDISQMRDIQITCDDATNFNLSSIGGNQRSLTPPIIDGKPYGEVIVK